MERYSVASSKTRPKTRCLHSIASLRPGPWSSTHHSRQQSNATSKLFSSSIRSLASVIGGAESHDPGRRSRDRHASSACRWINVGYKSIFSWNTNMRHVVGLFETS